MVGGLVAIGGGVVGLTYPGEGHSMWPAGALLFGAALLFYLTEVIWPD
jgi:hypothetical protein